MRLTKSKLWEEINKNEDISNLLLDLWERWQDNMDSECIKDYLHPIRDVIPEASAIYSYPFRIVCICLDGTFNISVQENARSIELVGEMMNQSIIREKQIELPF